LRRLGMLAAVLALAMLLTSPAFAQDSLADDIINDIFDGGSDSPSQTTYNQPGDGGPDASVPPQVAQALCETIVQNEAVPTFVQTEIAEQFGLGCEPVGSFLDAFLDGTFFVGILG